MGVERSLHWPWLGFAVEQALERGLCEAKDVLSHATAEVLAAQLPREFLTALFSRALAAQSLTPAHVLETAPPSVLAEHLEPEVMWRCIQEVAERAGLTQQGGTRTEAGRHWLQAILQGALETELLSPADLMRHLPPAEFVRDAPLPVMAELIKAGLLGGKFDPALVLQHLTPQVIAENLESSPVWACISEAVAARFELTGSPVRREEDHTGKIPLPKKNGRSPQATLRETPLAPVAPKRKAQADPTGPFDLPAPEEWSGNEELDVLEDAPLPPPPNLRRKS